MTQHSTPITPESRIAIMEFEFAALKMELLGIKREHRSSLRACHSINMVVFVFQGSYSKGEPAAR